MRKEGKPSLLRIRRRMEKAGHFVPELDKMRNWLNQYEVVVWQAYQKCGTQVTELIAWLGLYDFTKAEVMAIIEICCVIAANLAEEEEKSAGNRADNRRRRGRNRS